LGESRGLLPSPLRWVEILKVQVWASAIATVANRSKGFARGIATGGTAGKMSSEEHFPAISRANFSPQAVPLLGLGAALTGDGCRLPGVQRNSYPSGDIHP